MDEEGLRHIRRAELHDAEELAGLADLLWPGHGRDELRAELEDILGGGDGVVFICLNRSRPIGFAHCSIRRDYVEGSEQSPTAYLEGIFVSPEHRGEGAASELLKRCEKWASSMGCTEMASDCELENADSEKFHKRAGFTEVNRIICFIKKLAPNSTDSHILIEM